MADDDPKKDSTIISPEVGEEIVNAVFKARKENVNTECDVCGANSWGVEPRIFTPHMMEYNKRLKRVAPAASYPIYPLAMIVCSNCGNTHMINLNVLGFTSLNKIFGEAEDDDVG